MSNDFFTAPSSNVDSTDLPQLSPVNAPKLRWLVVVWMFFGLGIWSSRLGILMAQFVGEDELFGRRAGTVLLVLVIVLMVGVARLNRRLIVSSSIVCALVCVFQIVSLFFVYSEGIEIQPLVGSLALFAIPAALSSWYLSRPSLLLTAEKYCKFRELEKMQMHVAKKLRKGA